ncbi:amidohydrolase family protein [Winogradskyella immobilis]|uniref:PD40 domain-containing protein n=1 Tax=Winogradskyella immobilis TaxID=2816852 RepID=A0ABS8EPD2_9FLAO|nr:amidohydrolase family protein [Winogradskyella immobilis]MCC1485073.1 PD40 domain-containing protein [Winogradskyella immobilis]MCG0017165.1 amidohydrolase family protein [Winogradskyella immobilis]
MIRIPKLIKPLGFLTFLCFLTFSVTSNAQEKDSLSNQTKFKDLPLKSGRIVKFNTNEGTWLSLDISPDGKTIVFDMLGDLYTIPVSGGTATRITDGMALDTNPRYSPDGKSIVFTSDRSGNDNAWTMNLESKETHQVTKDKKGEVQSAEWSPDGNYIVVAKGKRTLRLHLYHKDGGGGARLITQPGGLKTIEPAFSYDGKLIYYSRRNGAWNYNAQLPQYQISTYDLDTGDIGTVTSRYGSAFTPTLSSDGKWLVYGSRYEENTGLVIRDLSNGDERWLAYPVQRDEQESVAPLGVLPAMTFTPDNQSVLASYGGKIYRIPVTGGNATEIPFNVNVELAIGPALEFKYPISDNKDLIANQIRDAKPSPDGKELVFNALNKIYVMKLPDGKPKRLTSMDIIETQPRWSPDGKSIVYTTWSETDGGHIYKVENSNRATPIKLTTESALYGTPVWDAVSNRIVATKGSAQNFRNAYLRGAFSGAEDLVWIPSSGGNTTFIAKTNGRRNPHFVDNGDRIYLSSRRGLSSIRWDGTDEKQIVSISGIVTFGSANDDHDHSYLEDKVEDPEENAQGARPVEIYMAPKGNRAMALINNDVYVVTIPKIGKTPNISVANPKSSQFPSWKLTQYGGEFPAWSKDAKKVHWSIGNAHFIYDLEAAKLEEERLEAEKKARKEELSKLTDDERKAEEKKDKEKAKDYEPYKAEELKLKVEITRDIPKGTALIKGARIITMNNDEVIENGDILIVDNRIKEVGPSGSLTVPNNAEIIDASGKTIMPGMVDTHSHLRVYAGIHKKQVWSYAANLAYGVTATRDPQTGTTDVLTYFDLVKTGEMLGPRAYSTGPGLGSWAYHLKSLDHTRDALKKYSEYYNTNTIKMYNVGNRQHRQWVIEASKEQKLMPTTEGSLDFKRNMTEFLDGYPGHEHSYPITPLYKDILEAAVQSKIAYTPTLLVSYGGPWAENYFYSRENPYHDKKLQYFTPYTDLAGKSRRRPGWFMDEEHVFTKHAEFVDDLINAGGLAGVGSHGQLQGLGYHWELWATASGTSTVNALKAATILGAQSIGLDGDIGSIEVGKLADIVILDKNPLDNIRHTNTVFQVMKNGRLYDGNTLDEVYPRQKKASGFWWQEKKPEGLPGIKN